MTFTLADTSSCRRFLDSQDGFQEVQWQGRITNINRAHGMAHPATGANDPGLSVGSVEHVLRTKGLPTC